MYIDLDSSAIPTTKRCVHKEAIAFSKHENQVSSLLKLVCISVDNISV